MQINGINGGNGTNTVKGQTMLQGTDAVTKSLQKQIANAQKALQELSANKDMSVEEKMQKRQELQQQLNDLNNQLRQHQIDLRRERQQAQKSSKEETAKKQQEKEDTPGYGMSKAGMEAMVCADTAMKQAEVYGRTGTQLKGEARVLAGEIKMDKDRGVNVEQKEEKLAKLEERIQDATASQIDTLEGANQKLQEVNEKEREENLKDDGKKETEKTGGKSHTKETKQPEAIKYSEETNHPEETKSLEETKPSEKARQEEDGRYVDIRL